MDELRWRGHDRQTCSSTLHRQSMQPSLRSESCQHASSSLRCSGMLTPSWLPSSRRTHSRSHPGMHLVDYSRCKGHQPRGRSLHRARAAAQLPSASAAVAANALGSSWFQAHDAVALAQLLAASGAFVLCLAAACFLIACIPTLWSAHKLTQRAEAVMKIVEQELPESSYVLRLSGLEVADCISEISRLGSDLSSGIQSTAKIATMTEQGMRQSIQGAKRAISEGLVPMAARTEQAARSVLEAELQQRAQLRHTQAIIQGVGQAAGHTAGAVRRARLGMQVMQLLGAAVDAGGAVRRTLHKAAHSNLAAAGAGQAVSANSAAST